MSRQRLLFGLIVGPITTLGRLLAAPPNNMRGDPSRKTIARLAGVSGLLILTSALPILSAQTMEQGQPMDHPMGVVLTHKQPKVKGQTFPIIYCGKGITDPNNPESLPAGDYGSDLHVVGPCVADGKLGHPGDSTLVPGGSYHYHWVFLHNGGTLTFSDAQLDLIASSILVLNGGTLQAGSDNDTDAIGAKGGLVTIHLWGANNVAGPNCQDQNGNDDIYCGVDPTIFTKNQMAGIYPGSCQPNPDDPQGDCFYQYDVDKADLPGGYFGRKVLAVSYGGTLRLFGKKGSTFDGLTPDPKNTGTSWTRLTSKIKTGDKTFTVSGAVDWEPGDHIVVSPTDYLPGHAEEAIIASATPGGDNTTIVISAVVLDDGTQKTGGFLWPHNGKAYSIPSDIQGKLKLDRDSVETRAAVGLLTRSIRIVSEGQSPTDNNPPQPNDKQFPPVPGNYFGGHLMFRQGFKQLQIQGVEFHQLGQGGTIARYPVHFHMSRKVPPDTFVKDCSISESMTRWITVHGTQGALVARNVGWKSIGHGFYIEDGSETDNKIYANLGVLARAGVENTQNPRLAPGILANVDIRNNVDPYNSDWQHPSIFWIMNGWNDFQYNMAAGAASCGLCYWMPAGANSGPSRYEYWVGYASRQRGLQDLPGLRDFNSGTTPLKSFVGNACSTAMFSFMEIGQLNSGCDGFGAKSATTVTALPGAGPSVPPGPPPKTVLDYYPILTGLRDPTKCNNLTGDCGTDTDPKNNKCNGTGTGAPDDETNCVATVLDHYTTSFNFAQKNFSSIWLRPWWKLVTDSAITDQLGPGLTLVTGGGYTRSDSALGNWDVALRTVFVGQAQTESGPTTASYSSDFGPFAANGISKCDNADSKNIPGGYCLSSANGISIPITPFNAGQRMFNIYDGPSFQDSNAYLDIKARVVPDCTPSGRDASSGGTGVCNASKYMYGHAKGLLQGTGGKTCYIPNAAIAWKQENGFYYPPAFHSKNLVFRNVDIRHFVVEPLFLPNTFTLNQDATSKRYCTWTPDLFQPFNDIDRQTVLNDDDGSLTGLLADVQPEPRETLSINLDDFFRAPKVVPECSSDKHDTADQKGPPATAITSPYEYVSTAVIAGCALKSVTDVCLDPPKCTRWDYKAECGKALDGGRNWGWACTHCYGVPLFRQNWTPEDNAECDADPKCMTDPTHRPGRIYMMGQSTGQRGSLTANHGWYYIDTTVPLIQQVGIPLQEGRSVFLSGQTYYVYLIYGKPDTQVEYWMYVGAKANQATVEGSVGRFRVNINSQVYGFNPKPANDPDFVMSAKYDEVSGWLKVKVDLSAYAKEFTNDKVNFCKPVSYCSWNGSSCGCKAGSDCKDDSVCSWGTKELDCPTKGCFGFSFTIQPEFDKYAKPGPPPPAAFPSDGYWNTSYKLVDIGTSGSECNYISQPK